VKRTYQRLSERTLSMLKVGIAGYGVVGKRRRKCVENNAGLVLVGICDKNIANDCVGPDSVHYLSNLDSLLALDLDVLIVSLPNDVAPQAVIAGIRRGLHVFCEKPPGRNLADIDAVIAEEQRVPQLKIMYGFNHRYHESVMEALKIIRSDQLGKIVNLKGVYGKSQLITFNQPDWRTRRDVAGGGVLLDQGIHMVDLMRLFAGSFEQIYSFVSNDYWGFDVEDNAYALMRTASGVVGMLNSSATQWRHRFNLDITCESGSLILGGILSSSKSYGAETLTIVNADPARDNGDPMETMIRYNSDPSWELEINDFVRHIKDDEPIHSGSTRDALETMRHVFRIYYADPVWRDRFDIIDPN
jgi:predicted dehydrogenase